MQPRGIFRLMTPLMRLMVGRDIDNNTAGLRQLAEGSQPGSEAAAG